VDIWAAYVDIWAAYNDTTMPSRSAASPSASVNSSNERSHHTDIELHGRDELYLGERFAVRHQHDLGMECQWHERDLGVECNLGKQFSVGSVDARRRTSEHRHQRRPVASTLPTIRLGAAFRALFSRMGL
jgi:hypothetical protein